MLMTHHTNLRPGFIPMDDLRKTAPSIFAERPHESRGSRYAFLPTSTAVEALGKEGFLPVLAKERRSRDLSRFGFTKHMVRLRRPDAQPIDGLFPEVVLMNSHDGTSRYHLYAGLFRVICENGLVVAHGPSSQIAVMHTGGDAIGKVIEGTYEVLSESVRAIERSSAWSKIELSTDEQLVLAEAAHRVRFENSDGTITTAIEPQQMLATRREADQGRSLWQTINVVQENMLRGGLTAMNRSGRRRRTTTRTVRGIDQEVRLNRALWMIGERMAELKAA